MSADSLNKMNISGRLLAPFPINSHSAVRLHALSVKIFVFCHIADIELNGTNITIVAHFEEIPVSMSLRICVTSEKTVILVFFYLNYEV